MMSCAFCGGSIENKTGPYKFDSTKLGEVIVPDITYEECTSCKMRYVSLKESEKISEYLETKKE